MAESERMSSYPMNLLVNANVGMWFWIKQCRLIHNPLSLLFCVQKTMADTHERFPQRRRGKENES